MPQLVAALALARGGDPAVALRQVGASPDVGRRPRLRAVRGLGRRAHGLGRSALTRPDGVRRSRRAHRRRPDPRRLASNIGWHDTRIINGELPGISFPWALLLGAAFASLVAVLVGIGALRVRGLLLAISTLAFAIAAQAYIFSRPDLHRRQHHGRDPTRRHRSARAHAPQPRVLLLRARSSWSWCWCSSGTCKRTGIGRMIVGVRENELAAVRDDGVAGARQAHRVRDGRVHRRPRRRAPRRGEPHVRAGSSSASSSSRTRCGWSPSP